MFNTCAWCGTFCDDGFLVNGYWFCLDCSDHVDYFLNWLDLPF